MKRELGTETTRYIRTAKKLSVPHETPAKRVRGDNEGEREETETEAESDKFRLLDLRAPSFGRFGRMSKVPILDRSFT